MFCSVASSDNLLASMAQVSLVNTFSLVDVHLASSENFIAAFVLAMDDRVLSHFVMVLDVLVPQHLLASVAVILTFYLELVQIRVYNLGSLRVLEVLTTVRASRVVDAPVVNARLTARPLAARADHRSNQHVLAQVAK